MEDAEKRIKTLEKTVEVLIKRLTALEKQSSRAYHTSSRNEGNIRQVQNGLAAVQSKLKVQQ